jgi:hypothetical protein
MRPHILRHPDQGRPGIGQQAGMLARQERDRRAAAILVEADEGQHVLGPAFGLEPELRPAALIPARRLLRDDALETHLLGSGEELRAGTREDVAEADRPGDAGEKIAEALAPLEERPAAEVLAVEVEEIEADEDRRPIACDQSAIARHASLVLDDSFAVDVVAMAVAEYVAERRRRDADRRRATADVEKKIGAVKRAASRILDLVADGRAPPSALQKLYDLEAEESRLTAERDAAPNASTIALHPGMAERFRATVRDLRARLTKSGEGRTSEAIATVRSLIDRIVIYPRDDARGDLELHGKLAAILQPEEMTKARKSMGSLVAGVGFEPTTFRL